MNKKLSFTIFLAFILGFSVNAAEIQDSTINTEATISREVMPDMAKIRFMVENSGTNLADLKIKNDDIAKKAIAAIKQNLSQNESIKTIAFNVRNVYSYKDKIRVFQKYEVQNGFEVKLKDLDKVSKIINSAMENGVKKVNNVSFYVENSEDVCNEMMADAVKIGKKRVEHLANAAGVELSKAKSIHPYCSLSSSNVQNRALKTYSSNAVMDSIQSPGVIEEAIEPGSINAKASVNLIYYLK